MTNKAPCQIFGKNGYRALDCFHRIDFAYRRHHPLSQLAAMAANTNTKLEEQTWLVYNGANQHITIDMENLVINEPYTGGEEITVRNEFGLSITHIGSSFLKTPTCTLAIKDVLRCPTASANLLSINKSCHDNICNSLPEI